MHTFCLREDATGDGPYLRSYMTLGKWFTEPQTGDLTYKSDNRRKKEKIHTSFLSFACHVVFKAGRVVPQVYLI